MLQDGNNYVVVASANGAEQNPSWYHNLQSNPLVTIQINDRIMTAKASTAAASTRDRLRSKLLEIAPGYDAYEKRTTRQIPLVILQPINESK